jgi:hypothetical protein
MMMMLIVIKRGLRSHQSLPSPRDGQEISPTKLRREPRWRAQRRRTPIAGGVWRKREGFEEYWYHC